MVTDVDKDVMVPIMFAMDKTTISSSTNLYVFAIMFTTSLFDRKTRNQAHAWRPLGYIPIEGVQYSKAQMSSFDKHTKSLRLNMMFDNVLQSFRQAQISDALDGRTLT